MTANTTSPLRYPSWQRVLGWLGFVATLVGGELALAGVGLDAKQTAASSVNTSSLTWAHTVGSGTNRILIVSLSFRDGSVSATSVTYGGASLTVVGTVNGQGTQNRTEMWYLLAPPSGTANVVVSMSQSKEVVGSSVSYTGVSQSAPLGSFASANNQSTAASVQVNSASGELVIDTVTANGDVNTITPGGSQTQLWNAFSGTGDGGNARSGGSTQPGAATVTMSWALGDSKPWSIGAVALRPVAPNFVNLKTVQVVSDPVNGTTNPKFIPGAVGQYTVTITNQGGGSSDNNSTVITDPIPGNTKLYVRDLGVAGSGPVSFSNGASSSGLTYTFSGLGSTTDDLSFSNDGGATYNYTPTAGADGCDASVTHIKVNPKGTFAGASSSSPSFSISYRVCVK